MLKLNLKHSNSEYFWFSLEDKIRFYYKFFIEDFIKLDKCVKPLDSYKDRIMALLFDELNLYEYNNFGNRIFKEGNCSKGSQKLSSDLGHLTKCWDIDWLWIVHHIIQDYVNVSIALNLLENKSYFIYKYIPNKYYSAAENIYLENVITRKPKVLNINEIIKNGHGLKANPSKFLPVISATLWGGYSNEYWDETEIIGIPDGYIWHDEKMMFIPAKRIKQKVERKSKVIVTIGNKEYFI